MAEKNAVYLPRGQAPPPSSFLGWLWKEQIVNPAYREGNWAIARAVGLFGLGIAFVRSDFGAVLVPVF
ncbi:hypothetical protein Q5752_000641 [Cryptotrichosporon argae]